MNEQQLNIQHQGALLVIQLNRPAALNALSLALVEQLKRALIDAFANAEVKTIWLESAFAKAFCAGGDVKALAQEIDTQRLPLQKSAIGRQYFQAEYSLDLLIEQSPKPIVAFTQGITFGGGWGLYAGANLKLATSAARFAMPENQIGLYPDVGAAHFLQQPDWRVGTLLGLSGITLSAQEAMALDYVDDLISEDYAATLKHQLANGLDVTELDIQSADPELAELHHHWSEAIALLEDDCTLTDWLNIAEQNPGFTPFKRAIENWKTASAWSLALTWYYFQRHRDSSRATVLKEDLQVASYCCRHPDFYEGVHAKLIDKDRSPVWHYAHVESVPLADLEKVFDFDKNKKE